MTKKHAPEIVDTDTQPSSTTVEDGQEATEITVQDDRRTLGSPVGCANPPEITETGATESDAYLATKQSPLTRSTPRHPHEKPQKSANRGADSRACATHASYIREAKSDPTLSNRSRNHPGNCHTRASYKPSVRGLWLRGAIYQFRVRVPADLRAAMGCIHVNRSLKTDSRSLAVRLSRKVAFEVEKMFEEKRRESGLPFDDRTTYSPLQIPA